jgi:hypothetical protein
VHHEDKRYTGYTKSVIDAIVTQVRHDTPLFNLATAVEIPVTTNFSMLLMSSMPQPSSTKNLLNLEQGFGLSCD